MLIKTKAVVLTTLKYSDTSLIVKCFTESDGIKSYLLKGILNSKKRAIKAAYFQPLAQLEIVANHKNKGALENIKEVKPIFPYKTLHTEIKKSTIALFLSETINNSLKEEEKNTPLYNFLENAFIWLDTNKNTSNFHIIFLITLSKYLGFYPNNTEVNFNYFDLQEGKFTQKQTPTTIDGQVTIIFKQFLGINFDNASIIKLTQKNRQTLLQTLIFYFELHLPGFKKPKSLFVFNEVFQ